MGMILAQGGYHEIPEIEPKHANNELRPTSYLSSPKVDYYLVCLSDDRGWAQGITHVKHVYPLSYSPSL